MPDHQRKDPNSQFKFVLEVDGMKAAFSEVSGLTSEGNAGDYRAGNRLHPAERKLSGLRKYGTITLKRGWTKDQALWDWGKKVVEGKTKRLSGSIVQMDEARQPVMRWKFRAGLPSKWVGPDLNAEGNEVAIETLEITHEGVALDKE